MTNKHFISGMMVVATIVVCEISSCSPNTIGNSNISPNDITLGVLDALSNYESEKKEVQHDINQQPFINDSAKANLLKYKRDLY